jgi:hypothetical protein
VIADVRPVLQRDVVQAPEQLLEGDPQVQAGEVRAGAAVRTDAEAQMAVPLAIELEVVRIAELGVVPVGRGPVDQYLVTLPDLMAFELGVAQGRAADRDERGVEPQQLLDGRGYQLRLAAQQRGNPWSPARRG